MKKKSALRNHPVKRKKKKSSFAVFGAVHRVVAGLLKISFVFALVALISVGFLYLYHYLIASPYMKLQEVKVEGVDSELRHELIQASGLHSDLSLLAINLNSLKEKLTKHPWVRSVNLERRFPHTLIVQAEKETPWALVVID
ncbi:MAG: FtsQ-type POTRA domain-containing protein, partial [Desulfobacteraceae bacterium]